MKKMGGPRPSGPNHSPVSATDIISVHVFLDSLLEIKAIFAQFHDQTKKSNKTKPH